MSIGTIHRTFSRELAEAMLSNPVSSNSGSISGVSRNLPFASASHAMVLPLARTIRNIVGLASMFQHLRPSTRRWQECSDASRNFSHYVADAFAPHVRRFADEVVNGRRSTIAIKRSKGIDDDLATAALAEFLGDSSCAVKADVEKRLSLLCSESKMAMRALFVAAKRGRTWEIRRRAARIFARVGTPKLALEGVKGYGDSKTLYRLRFLRRASMKVLAAHDAERFADVFIKLSQDKDNIIRFESLPYLAWLSTKLLVNLNGEELELLVKAIVARMVDKKNYVRRRAAEVVGKYLIRAATKPLLRLLKDRDPWVRDTAAYALAEIGDISVLPALKAARYEATLKGGHRKMLNAVEYAVKKIYKRMYFGDDRHYVDLKPLAG